MSTLMQSIGECILDLSNQSKLMKMSEEDVVKLRNVTDQAKKATVLGAEYELKGLRRELRDLSERYYKILSELRRLEVRDEEGKESWPNESDKPAGKDEECQEDDADGILRDEESHLEQNLEGLETAVNGQAQYAGGEYSCREKKQNLYQRMDEVIRAAHLEMKMLERERREMKEKKKMLQEMIEEYSSRWGN